MIKRNSIVTTKSDRESGAPWIPYARVVQIDKNKALIISGMRDYEWIALDDLEEVCDYKGRWDKRYLKSYWTLEDRTNEDDHIFYVWLPMPTLRKLKQRARHYHPEVFRKNRKKLNVS